MSNESWASREIDSLARYIERGRMEIAVSARKVEEPIPDGG